MAKLALVEGDINGFSAEEVRLMDGVLEKAWNITKARDPFRDPGLDPELRLALTRRVLGLYAKGVKDADMLLAISVRTDF
jgi:hypothetical protein